MRLFLWKFDLDGLLDHGDNLHLQRRVLAGRPLLVGRFSLNAVTMHCRDSRSKPKPQMKKVCKFLTLL